MIRSGKLTFVSILFFLSFLFIVSNRALAVGQKENIWVHEKNMATYSYVESHKGGDIYSYVVTLQFSPEYHCLMPEIGVLFMKGRVLDQPINQEQVDPSALLIVFDKENAYRNLTFKTKFTNGVEYGTRLTDEALDQFKSSKKTIFKLVDTYFITTNNETLKGALKKASDQCLKIAKSNY